MSTGTVVPLVLALLLAAAAAVLAGALIMRRMALRQGAGPEYDRLVREVGPRRAKTEFAQRRQRVADLGIKPLTVEQQAGYTGQWATAQERFIDSPPQAAQAAAALVAAVAADRGYPATDHTQLLTDLSVHHGRWLDRYRRARRTTDRADAAATEELRQALLDHRALFRDLLGAAAGGDGGNAWWRPAMRLTAWRRVRPAAAFSRLRQRAARGLRWPARWRLPARIATARPRR